MRSLGGIFLLLALVAAPAVADLTSFSYKSSVDGAQLTGEVFTPPGLRGGEAVPLVIYLHGGGGMGSLSRPLREQLAARGWIGTAPDGRRWGLANRGCEWQTSAAYVDNPDPAVGPGEQDIFDAIDWARGAFDIDDNRIYLMGFSMGGRGTYIIGLKNPDVFAAIAPMSPAIDMYEIFDRRPEPARACKEGMVGGRPGDSPFVDTMYTITSGRFLIENAYNLPVFHGHGTEDRVASNTPANAPFLHGWHLTEDNSWSACHGQTDLCFGHTPTLSELADRHRDGYEWAFMFTPVQHNVDPKWLAGTPESARAVGVDDPERPGSLLGLFDFFQQHQRVKKPRTVVYKTYTDAHEEAYWTRIKITKPWQNTPGAIRASRDNAGNSLELEMVRVKRATVRLKGAKLELSESRPLTVKLGELNEPTYDPALAPPPTAEKTTLVLRGKFKKLKFLAVDLDGERLSGTQVELGKRKITIGPLTVDRTMLLSVSAKARAASRGTKKTQRLRRRAVLQ